MYSVVTYVDGVEKSISVPKGWAETYAAYESIADKVNATYKKGNHLHPKGSYLYPEQRVSIRKA